MIKAIKERWYKIRNERWKDVERRGDTDSLTVGAAAQARHRAQVGAGERWGYLVHLIEQGIFTDQDVRKHANIFSVKWLFSYKQGMFVDEFARPWSKQHAVSEYFEDHRNGVDPIIAWDYADLFCRIPHGEFTTSEGVDFEVKYSRKTGRYVMIKHDRGEVVIPVTKVDEFSYLDNHLVINGHASDFEIVLKEDEVARFNIVIEILAQAAATNANNTDKLKSPEISSNDQGSRNSFNPWLAGALGAAAGYAAGALSDD